jgi:SulP family sulfate permease
MSVGAANTITSSFGGMGGCAVVSRSMINVKSGGHFTRRWYPATALFLLAFILFANKWSIERSSPLLVGVMFMVVIGVRLELAADLVEVPRAARL